MQKEKIIARLNNMPLCKWHYRLTFAGGMGVMLDSFDVALIGFIIPAVVAAWNLSKVEAGMIGSMGLVGMMLGAAVCGWLADRIGRKTVFMLTLLIFSIGSGLAALSTGLSMLLAFRLISGFGLGAEQPIANTLTSEMSPPAYRGRLLGLQLSGWGIGAVLASLASVLVIPVIGWKGGFLLGAIPALFVVYLRRNVPESVRYLLNIGKLEEAEKIVANIEKEAGVHNENIVVTAEPEVEEKAPKTSGLYRFLSLWSRDYWKRSFGLWILWFAVVFSFYGLYTWLPTFVMQQGFGMTKSFTMVMAMNIAQIPGIYCASYFVDKIGRRKTIAIFMLAAAVFAMIFTRCASPLQFTLVGAGLMFFIEGAFCMMHVFSTEQYPTQMRATGYGFGSAFGRLGGVVAPMVVGYLLSSFGDKVGFTYSFGVFVVAFVVGALIMWICCPETAGMSLEKASARRKMAS